MTDTTIQTLKAAILTVLAVATAVCAVGTVMDGTIPLWITIVFACSTIIVACLAQEDDDPTT